MWVPLSLRRRRGGRGSGRAFIAARGGASSSAGLGPPLLPRATPASLQREARRPPAPAPGHLRALPRRGLQPGLQTSHWPRTTRGDLRPASSARRLFPRLREAATGGSGRPGGLGREGRACTRRGPRGEPRQAPRHPLEESAPHWPPARSLEKVSSRRLPYKASARDWE